ncbi:DivIVA domain-containing protein [Micromonospora pattaloongensis]|uniref:DivIVA domain-containing protein n=1 Tax=Micromonospora pattaloongensis TaxID=405436 RepID=A0A1H3Q2C8_9ACTN|nr:DivIVA domain-containing protein [Micromonospora pattaloongensis]
MRQRRFALTRFGRRGLDPAEVGDFLERVAADLEGLYVELARTHEQNLRIKDALRRWQSQQAPSMREAAGG